MMIALVYCPQCSKLKTIHPFLCVVYGAIKCQVKEHTEKNTSNSMETDTFVIQQ
jgi:hypothetical protein